MKKNILEMSILRLLFLFLISLFLFGCATEQNKSFEPPAPILPPTVDPSDTVMAVAQRNYETLCAHCHGYAGDGQGTASEERTLSLGYRTVPRHDSEGHTWQHPDPLLFETIKHGVSNPLNLYVMSAFGDSLSDDEIWGVIEYIKRFWTEEERESQSQLTTQFWENDPNWEQYNLDIYADELE